MRRLQRMLVGSFSLSLVVAAIAVPRSQERIPSSEWRYFGGDKAFTRYSPLDQITRDNVKNLRIVWRRPAVDDELTQAFPDLRVNNYLRSTPIMHRRHALHAERARPRRRVRRRERQDRLGAGAVRADARRRRPARATRGVDYWRGGAGDADQRIFADSRRVSLRAQREDRQAVPGFGDQGRASLHFDENQPLAGRFSDSTGPLVVGNVVVVTGNTAGAGDTGTFKKEAAPEDVRGFDAQTGKLLWTFHVVPQAGRIRQRHLGRTSRGRSPAISARGIR